MDGGDGPSSSTSMSPKSSGGHPPLRSTRSGPVRPSAQAYFAVQTRRMEVEDQTQDLKRLGNAARPICWWPAGGGDQATGIAGREGRKQGRVGGMAHMCADGNRKRVAGPAASDFMDLYHLLCYKEHILYYI